MMMMKVDYNDGYVVMKLSSYETYNSQRMGGGLGYFPVNWSKACQNEANCGKLW